MIDIETHKIVDLLESRQEDDVAEWLKTFPNIEVISRDGEIMYKSASHKAHSKAMQVSDRFHVLKNLTDYAKDALKRILKKQIKIEDTEAEITKSEIHKKYIFKSKWDLILKVKELRAQKYRIIDISQFLGISEKSVVEYNKIPLEDKEKYTQLSSNELKSKVSQENKWQLIQEVQAEYKKCHKYSVVARKFKLNDRTVKKYISITEAPIHANKNNEYVSKLSKYKNDIIKMNNEGCTWKVIWNKIISDGYQGSDSLLRTYLAKIKKKSVKEKNIQLVVERSTLISLLYKKIDEVKNITKEVLDKVIFLFLEASKVYSAVKDFKDIMFSKKANKLDEWMSKTKKYKIPEMNSFINGIERDIEAVKHGITYDYNNGLAEGSVNKIKVIKRIMYGRCSFDLLKQKVLLQY